MNPPTAMVAAAVEMKSRRLAVALHTVPTRGLTFEWVNAATLVADRAINVTRVESTFILVLLRKRS